jgi:hypothetical protein
MGRACRPSTLLRLLSVRGDSLDQVEATGRAAVEAGEKGLLSVTKRAHAIAVGFRARPS